MAAIVQVTLCICLVAQCMTVYGTESDTDAKEEKSEELVQSESKDGKLEIIKRIKKINDDGSYTIGYEADDGSFKIESRDVLGQIKGTYGFVDEGGQIKRVSYSTSNSSELISRPEQSSVVQRIPNKNKTTSTRIPVTTQSTPTTTSNSVIQSIARRRASTTTSTTQKPNYNDVINVAARTTNRSNPVTYTSSPPRVLVQNRLPISSTVATQTHTAKSEGQLIRPETVTLKPTELPFFRRLTFKQLDDKPVTEDPEPEGTGNILRRQLSQENTRDYNVQEHLYSLQQSLGHDATDVYSSSMTTGTPRPLFTTTNRPRIVAIPSPSTSSLNVPRPTVRYPLNYQRNVLQDLERNSPEYSQETTTSQPVSVPSTQAPHLSAVQIPPNKADPQEPLVAIRHPFQRGTILVPLSQIQGRLIPVESVRDINEPQKQHASQQEPYFRETTTRPNVVEVEQQQAVVRRLPPPPLRPIPVQVDENGFIREVPRQVQTPYPVPVPVPVMHMPKYVDNEIDNDIDNIEPPVSTRDFQKLLQQLIARQSRLEKISALTRQHDIYLQDQQQQQQQQRYRTVYSEEPEQYYVRREPSQSNGPVQFIQRRPEEDRQRLSPQQFFEQKPIPVRSQQVYENHYEQQSYRPNRRVARLLPSKTQQRQQELQEEYLPPDVREMLLLRMLQLAINPSLPLDEDKFDLPTAATQIKRMPVRNVEILGEEEPDEPRRRPERSKRYRESEIDFE